ncbi:hypothetical protein F5Y18DRAFT_111778 [Xylariaceae sp. FL1019]|nr:hypothetical protein F5Y18DRAFT_111778 [Xylariaceae sp. FL1019]
MVFCNHACSAIHPQWASGKTVLMYTSLWDKSKESIPVTNSPFLSKYELERIEYSESHRGYAWGPHEPSRVTPGPVLTKKELEEMAIESSITTFMCHQDTREAIKWAEKQYEEMTSALTAHADSLYKQARVMRDPAKAQHMYTKPSLLGFADKCSDIIARHNPMLEDRAKARFFLYKRALDHPRSHYYAWCDQEALFFKLTIWALRFEILVRYKRCLEEKNRVETFGFKDSFLENKFDTIERMERGLLHCWYEITALFPFLMRRPEIDELIEDMGYRLLEELGMAGEKS